MSCAVGFILLDNSPILQRLKPMLSFFSSVLIAQAAPVKPAVPVKPDVIVQPQEIRTLPGQLDSVLVFNSNSPEVVQTEGILLSTFSKVGKAHPEAHLDQPLQGRFDVFAHHISNKAKTPDNPKTLYLGILVFNPSSRSVTVNVLQAASYLSQPDAPFTTLPPTLDNPIGSVFAGPGDRVTNDILRGLRQPDWPATLEIPPGSSRLLFNAPIPTQTLTPPINGRSTLAHLLSTGEVRVASLALFAKTDAAGQERAPTLDEWEALLTSGTLAGPRDKTPTPVDQKGPLVYGRVAGVARGSRWQAQLINPTRSQQVQLAIPEPGGAFSYPLSTVARGTFGTGQVHSATMIARYPDTAYAAHGNYGVEYNLTLPLYNPTQTNQTVSVLLQTPLKTDEGTALKFNSPPPPRVFFRGTVRLRYQDESGPQTRYVHLVQLQGQQGEPLVKLSLKPQASSLVQVDFLYPPDATPPQVLTIRTENSN
jgi:Protein of unknown function (DUF3370)